MAGAAPLWRAGAESHPWARRRSRAQVSRCSRAALARRRHDPGSDMASWVFCNRCFQPPQATSCFSLTNCGHVYCDVCLRKGQGGAGSAGRQPGPWAVATQGGGSLRRAGGPSELGFLGEGWRHQGQGAGREAPGSRLVDASGLVQRGRRHSGQRRALHLGPTWPLEPDTGVGREAGRRVQNGPQRRRCV